MRVEIGMSFDTLRSALSIFSGVPSCPNKVNDLMLIVSTASLAILLEAEVPSEVAFSLSLVGSPTRVWAQQKRPLLAEASKDFVFSVLLGFCTASVFDGFTESGLLLSVGLMLSD